MISPNRFQRPETHAGSERALENQQAQDLAQEPDDLTAGVGIMSLMIELGVAGSDGVGWMPLSR